MMKTKRVTKKQLVAVEKALTYQHKSFMAQYAAYVQVRDYYTELYNKYLQQIEGVEPCQK